MTSPTFLSADAVAPAALHAAFVHAFSDYLIGPFALTPEQWPGFLARQAVDLALSRAALVDGAIQAFAFVAARPEADPPRWRLATMGALPSARGSGSAPALLDDFIARAAAAGLAAVELEVFAQNERALRLYQSRGFELRHELHGYEHAPRTGAAQPSPFEAVSREAALDWLRRHEPADLPLQAGHRVLAANPSAWTAWQSGQAQLVFGPVGERLVVHSLVDLDPAQPGAEALLRALLQAQPERAVSVPQLQRLDLGGAALRRLGFGLQPLHQVLMRRAI